VAYFHGLERYIADIFHNESRLNQAMRHWNEERPDAARDAMSDCRPEKAVERFAEFSRLGGISRGELGLLVTMNTRWLTHYQRVRQAMGLEPVRIRYASTSHDLLAQSRGTYTFHYGPRREIWETQGQVETQADVFALPPEIELSNPQGLDAGLLEVCRSGITSANSIDLTIRPIFPREKLFKNSTRLPAGDYQLQLLFVEPSCDAAGQRVFQVAIGAGQANEQAKREVDVFAAAGGRHRAMASHLPVRLEQPGTLHVRLTPVRGQPLICGAVLTPKAR